MRILKKSNFAPTAAGIFLFIFLFIFSEAFLKGINAGLLNCVNIVIPSLFPFMTAASLAGSGNLPKPLKKAIEPITQFLFHLPAESITAIILGQLGGYLSGVKTTEALCNNGIISQSQAKRMLFFCISPGIGFTVNALGNAMLSSREAGKVILLSVCISSLMLGVLTRFFADRKNDSFDFRQKTPDFSSAVVNSVTGSAYAMLAACAFVAVFSGFSAVCDQYIKNETAKLIINCFSEVTNTCAMYSGKFTFPATAAVCAFGGICVHLQVFALAKNAKPDIFRFYLFRFLHSALSFILCSIILKFHPIEKEVFISVSDNFSAFSFSAPAAISLLFMCALLILDLDNGKKIC